MSVIKDGQGKGYGMGVNSEHRALVHSVTETESEHATEFGKGYNINTGNITLSAATGCLYFKNNETEDFVLDAIAVGMGSGTLSDSAEITVILNPTTGTLISTATAVDMNGNKNGGSANTLSASLAYKGASGATITDGAQFALLYQTAASREFYKLGIIIPNGKSVAIKIDPKLSSGTMKAYVAFVSHLKPFTEV